MMSNIGEGATPLMYACQQSREKEVLDILARKPKAVRDRDRTLKTPLHYCAENTNTGCAEAILRVAPDLLDAKDEDGYTALHLAVIAGNKLLLRLLISRGANVNALDNEKHTAVHWATVCGEQEALEMLLRAGANISTADIHGGYPLHYAAQMCGPGSEMGGDPRIGLSVLRALLSYGVDINVQDKDGRQPILWAASAGSADAILALVNAGASVEAADKDGLTALHCAASRGHTDCLETLVALCGANVDVIDSNGCTALFYSVTLGHADSTQLLLSLGAEPNRQDRKGRTPAHCGAAKGQLETLRILLNHGANLWLRNVKGDFPLHEAVASGRRDLVRWLLNQRPDAVNVSNNDGRCPIHVAAMNNNVEMIKILFDYQSLVNPIMRTSKNVLMTPLDAAMYRGNRSCAKYLQLHGGVPFTKLTETSSNLRGTSSKQVVPEPQLGVSDGFQHTRHPLNTLSTGLATNMIDSQGRMNDDVAIQLVERIEMPNENESSGEEEKTYRRRRRRRRSDQRKKDFMSEQDSDSEEKSQDSRTRPRRKRKESEEDDRKPRRRKKDRSEESGSEDGFGRRRSRKKQDSSYESEEDEDHYRVRRKKHYSVSEDSEVEEGKKKSKREDENQEKEGISEGKAEEPEKQTVEVLVHSELEIEKEIADSLVSNQHVEEPIVVTEETKGEPAEDKEQEEESLSKDEPTIEEVKDEETKLREDYENELPSHGFEEEDRAFYPTGKKPEELFQEEEVPPTKKEDAEDYDESFRRKGSLKRQPVTSARKRRSYMTKTESEEREEMVSRMADVDTVIKGVRLGEADGRSTSMGDDSGGSTRNEDSSVLLDSGIEPSPRRGRKPDYEMPEKREIETATSRRSRVPRLCRKGKPDEDDEENVHTISVTQAVQNTIRKYHMERRIFYQLLELKRLQIRAGRSNEQVLVKRLVDEYKRAGLVPGLKHYNGSYTFKQFEHFLYDQLHALQSTGQVLIPHLKPSDDIETLSTILKKTRVQLLDDIPDNPILCTHGTHRCHHAAHAYTGIPCAAYITKLSHHEMPKTRTSGFLPRIDPSPSSRPGSKRMSVRPVTLELSHGAEKQVISLPTDRLDKNKRYYVTFTIKGAPTPEDSRPESTREEIVQRHRHAKSF